MGDIAVEVLPFLFSDQRNDVRENALMIFLAKENLLSEMTSQDILKLISAVQACLEVPTLTTLALSLLVNISAESVDVFQSDSTNLLFDHCFRLLREKNGIVLITMLLANISSIESIAKKIINSDQDGQNFAVLIIDSFMQYNPQVEPEAVNPSEVDWDELDKWQHSASIICNLSQLQEGRALLCRRSSNYIASLSAQIGSRNSIRRRGAVASLRNCLFDSDEHWWLVKEQRLLPALLAPLVVSTPFNEAEMIGMDSKLWMLALDDKKKHESDREILKMLLESILMLCQRRIIREELRKAKVYPIVRNLDYIMEDEELSNMVLDIVNFLMRDDIPLEEDEKARDELAMELHAARGSLSVDS